MAQITFSTSFLDQLINFPSTDLLLAASKENTRELSQSSVSPNSKMWKCKAKGTCLLMKGLGRYVYIHEGRIEYERFQSRLGAKLTESKL